MKSIEVKLPEETCSRLDLLVREGWFSTHQDIISQAVQRFLDSHRPELMEKFILEDVEWGLHGQ